MSRDHPTTPSDATRGPALHGVAFWCVVTVSVAAGAQLAAEQYPRLGLFRIALARWTDVQVEGLAIAAVALLAGAALARLLGRIVGLAQLDPRARAVSLVATRVALPALALGVWLAQPGGVTTTVGTRWILVIAPLAALLAYAGVRGVARRVVRRPDAEPALLAVAAVAIVGMPAAFFAMNGRPPAPTDAPNLVMIVLDTVRADRISAYGHVRRTTPELDAFGRHAIRFSDFSSTSSWTVPSHASLFTGHYPRQHRATQETMWLEPRFATLAEVLQDAGYTTWAASGNPYMGPLVNLAQGFDDFHETWRGDPLPRPADRPHPVNVAFARFLDQRDPQRPFFAFLNYMDAHSPHIPSEPWLGRALPPGVSREQARELGAREWLPHYAGRPFTPAELELLSHLYDAGLGYLSEQVGRVLGMLEEQGRFDDSVIVVTADHGEHFGENGHVGHYFSLYNTTVRVPLWIHLPGGARAGEVSTRRGQLLDLFPTLLGVLGVTAPPVEHAGVDLLTTDPDSERRSVFSEYYYPRQSLGLFSQEERQREREQFDRFRRRLRAIERYDHRFIWSSNGDHELYDLAADPREEHDLYPEEQRTAEADGYLRLLEEELRRYAPEVDEPEQPASRSAPPDVEDETRDALRALGYAR